MSQPSNVIIASAPVSALAGWVVPGAGYVLIGQRARGLTIGITILVLFVLGLLIGGLKVLDAPDNIVGSPYNALLQKPWYMGQILAGPLAPAVAAIGKDEKYVVSHARANEIGTLYTAVAGMLNLLAIIDSAYRAGRVGRKEPQ